MSFRAIYPRASSVVSHFNSVSPYSLPKKTNQRPYATSPGRPSSSSSSSSTGLLVGLTVAVAGAGWYYWSGSQSFPSKFFSTMPKNNANGPPAFKGGDQGFFPLKLQRSETINHDTKLYRLAFPDPDSRSGLSVASAIVLKTPPGTLEEPVLRPYTPVSDIDQTGYIDVIVKKYPNAKMGGYLDQLQPGQEVHAKGPIPKFPYKPNQFENIFMIAGGTGITPMYQVIEEIFKNPSDKSVVTLIYGAKTEDDILLKKQLLDYQTKFPTRLKTVFLVDEPTSSWKGKKGFVTKELLREHLLGPDQGDKLKLFVCGPPGMYKALSGPKLGPAVQGPLTGCLKDLGYSSDQVFKF